MLTEPKEMERNFDQVEAGRGLGQIPQMGRLSLHKSRPIDTFNTIAASFLLSTRSTCISISATSAGVCTRYDGFGSVTCL